MQTTFSYFYLKKHQCVCVAFTIRADECVWVDVHPLISMISYLRMEDNLVESILHVRCTVVRITIEADIHLPTKHVFYSLKMSTELRAKTYTKKLLLLCREADVCYTAMLSLPIECACHGPNGLPAEKNAQLGTKKVPPCLHRRCRNRERDSCVLMSHLQPLRLRYHTHVLSSQITFDEPVGP